MVDFLLAYGGELVLPVGRRHLERFQTPFRIWTEGVSQ